MTLMRPMYFAPEIYYAFHGKLLSLLGLLALWGLSFALVPIGVYVYFIRWVIGLL
ncbi:hypothetical protein BpOF4_07705 [Alkalihalophilus pseudofirmus OF4]|uniref:Uncharacterized protein n=1 Tax=Alkalihalophilus pseudofirmus (strain ATCC BAA-2126 / JCM 17055 / OF4) TaxID=398511 RepID=D3FQC7_ALKPO|nr:hypothetical protein BpOF4_07705 [Alkalihalophilus pseudofirmus OF4]